MPKESMDGDGKNVVSLSADHFPPGMSPKEGDKITFCVTGMGGEDGAVSGYFEGGGEGKEDGEFDMARWEKFKSEMSPTEPQEQTA